MRFTAASVITMAGIAAAAWSPDEGSHGGAPAGGPPAGSWGGEHGAPGNGSSWGGDSYTTEVVTAFTTFCPEATQITHGGYTYSVTSPTTLTITNCPGGCTITKPVWSSKPVPTTPAAPVTTWKSTPVAPVPYSSPAVSSPVAPAPVYPSSNGTSAAPVAPSGTGAQTYGAPVPQQTGNAASTYSAGAAGILAIFGLVAAL